VTVKRKRGDTFKPFEHAASKIPFSWVIDEIAALDPTTRPMFGCTAVYARGKIVFILREKGGEDDDGVWVATTRDHHESLRQQLPSMRSITVLAGGGETGWQILPVEADGFEEEVLRACALVRADDPRIGKVPKPKKRPLSRGSAAKTAKAKKATKRSPPARSSRSRRAP
jgi:hypothetical protein